MFRVTTAGTSTTEPTWPAGNNATVTAGATFTNVSGQSAYGWSAAAGTLYCMGTGSSNGRPVVGDRMFLGSDHSENLSGALTWGFSGTTGTAAYGVIQILSVNRAGSVPPVAADALSGAAITDTVSTTQNMTLDAYCNMYWQGITFTLAGTPSSNAIIALVSGIGRKGHYFKNCAFVLANTTGTSGYVGNSANAPAKAVFDNTTVQFALAAQFVGAPAGIFDLQWINTPSAIHGSTIPSTLFSVTSIGTSLITCRGVDISAVTGTLATLSSSGGGDVKMLLDSCGIASGVVRLATPLATSATSDEAELVGCYDGTNTINERYTAAGAVTTDRTTYLTGGAADDIGSFSLKLVSSTRSDFATMPLDSFWIDVENIVTGASKTATVEIVSSASLNNNDIRLLLEYQGTSGSPVASFADSLASVLTAASALPTSTATWNSPPSTPVTQHLQVTFTPQVSGRVRGLVRLGKTSTTVWVNPQIAIT